MPKCVILPSRVVKLGRGLKHVAPECHVSVITTRELKEELAEQRFHRDHWSPGYANTEYGKARLEINQRFIAGKIDAAGVASALDAAAKSWPGYDLEREAAWWRAKAEGKRLCSDCGMELAPIPPCDCGCQRPLPTVPGFSKVSAKNLDIWSTDG